MGARNAKRVGVIGVAAALVVTAAVLFAGGRSVGRAQSEAPLRMAPAGKGIAGRYIVVFRRDRVTSASAVRGKVAQARGATGMSVRHVYERALFGYAAQLSDAALAQVRADPDVAYVAQDGVVRAVQTGGTQSDPPWGLDRIDQRSLPLNESYSYDVGGTDVHVYVIDTGIRSTHAEFGGRVEAGFDAVDGGTPDDCNGHGTHVAGTIGGATYGVAKNVTLHGVRVLDCEGSGSDSDVIAGIDWVTENSASPAVANMSLGGSASAALDEAVRTSVEAGVVYVVAAGNEDVDACYGSPAREPAAITVGATDAGDARAWFSNYGDCLDLFAPGVDIRSAWKSSNTAVASLSGTSMAAPHVAGAAALYLERNATAKPPEVAAALVSYATSGVVTDAQAGSPNRLLYVLPASSGPTPTAPPLSTAQPGQGANDFDDPSKPRVIASLPYRDVASVASATTDRRSEPWPMGCGDVENAQTVWYRYTAAASGWLTIDTVGSNYDTVVEVYEDSSSVLLPLTCNDDTDDSLQARVGLAVTSGKTYYVQVASFVSGFLTRGKSGGARGAAAAAGSRLVLQASLDVGGSGPTPTPTLIPTSGPTPLPVNTPSPTQPWLNNLWPDVVQVGDGEWIWVTGGNLDAVTTARLGARTVQIDSIGDEAMYLYAPDDLPAGTYDLQVCNASGECATKPEAFTVYAQTPEIYQMIPDRAAYGESTDVWVIGYNFAEGMTMTIGGSPVDELQVYSSDVIRVRPPTDLAVGAHIVGAFLDNTQFYAEDPFIVFGSDSDDWYAFEEDLWSMPLVVRSGDVIELGLNVHRQGGDIPMQVGVSFYEIVDGTPQLIDHVLTPPMSPGKDVIDTVSTLWPIVTDGDSATIMAVIDEDEWIDDLNRTDNVVTRTISILPPSADAAAPRVSSFEINGGALETSDAHVTLTVGVTEAVSAMYVVEREFNTVAGMWVPVQSIGWIGHQTSYPLTLTGSSGMRYVQAWVSDAAGNISSPGGYAVINYNAAPEDIALGQMRVFRYPITLGSSAVVRLDTLSGDADLYVWNPDGTLAGYSVASGTADDVITVTATISGEHQVEVYGYAAGQYRLIVENGADARPSVEDGAAARPDAPMVKAVRSAPAVQPESLPPVVVALSNAPVGGLPAAPASTPTGAPVSPTATRTVVAPTPTSGADKKVYVPITIR